MLSSRARCHSCSLSQPLTCLRRATEGQARRPGRWFRGIASQAWNWRLAAAFQQPRDLLGLNIHSAGIDIGRGYPQILGDRAFSSRRRGGRYEKPAKKESNVLANEHLIIAIMKKHGSLTADDVDVRLVIDEGPDMPPTVDVVSLTEAIEISLDREVDLIATEINKDPPVIRATKLSKLIYRKEQMASKNKSTGKQSKSFRFRAGIGDHDLERKLADMSKSLSDGLDCEFTVFSKRKLMRVNNNAGTDLIAKILEFLGDLAELKKAPDKNEDGNFIRVSLVPAKRK
jgi:translation initiation factor IF-3